MRQKHHRQGEDELARLIHQFEDWRQTRTSRREPIPEPLWQAAISLTRLVPVSRVAKRLRLNRQELKRRCVKSPAVTPPVVSASLSPDFIEVKAEPSWLEPASSLEVEMERTDGARLRLVCRHAQPPVVALVHAFLETK